MIEIGHFEREDSGFGNSVRRPESPSMMPKLNTIVTHIQTQERMKSEGLPETAKIPLKQTQIVSLIAYLGNRIKGLLRK